jgi:RimJ/RimL family protein N-acetyltransferase
MATVALRVIQDPDLDAIFAMEQDPEAVRMAVFTPKDPTDRVAFDAHMSRIRKSPDVSPYVITDEGQFVGTAATFLMEGEREVTYWVERSRWGRGIATAALGELLERDSVRPLFARAASANVGSAAVLRKNGFVEIGRERSFAAGLGAEVEETIFRLDQMATEGLATNDPLS